MSTVSGDFVFEDGAISISTVQIGEGDFICHVSTVLKMKDVGSGIVYWKFKGHFGAWSKS